MLTSHEADRHELELARKQCDALAEGCVIYDNRSGPTRREKLTGAYIVSYAVESAPLA